MAADMKRMSTGTEPKSLPEALALAAAFYADALLKHDGMTPVQERPPVSQAFRCGPKRLGLS